LFKRKKKLTPWGEVIVKEKKRPNPASFKAWVSGNLRRTSTLFQPPKIHLRFLLKGKRFFAGGLCFVYLIVTLFALPNLISLLFFATFFILLDYLWKTRRMG